RHLENAGGLAQRELLIGSGSHGTGVEHRRARGRHGRTTRSKLCRITCPSLVRSSRDPGHWPIPGRPPRRVARGDVASAFAAGPLLARRRFGLRAPCLGGGFLLELSDLSG